MPTIIHTTNRIVANALRWKAANSSIGCDGYMDESWEISNSECHVTDHLCRIHDKAKIEKLEKATPHESAENGKAALIKMMADHKPVVDAMWRQTTGVIDFEWGHPGTKANDWSDGWGIAKIAQKHPEAVGRIADVVAHGTIYHDKYHPSDRLAIVYDESVVILFQDKNGAFVFNSFTPKAHNYISWLKRDNPPLEAGR